LKHSLQLLSSPADTQLGKLPHADHKSDALSLSFNHWRMMLLDNSQSEISAHQLSCLNAIQQKFVRMGSESWTDGAVSNSAEWKEIRALSTTTLEAFGWLR
jgi:hypothetical protein